MTRETFLNNAIDLCVGLAEETGVYFVEPLWQDILISEGFEEQLFAPENADILHILELAAKKLNAKTDRTKQVMDWLYDLITTTVDPAVMQEETELVKNVIEYMKTNDTLKEKERAIAAEEKRVEDKKDVSYLKPGMSFKRRI